MASSCISAYVTSTPKTTCNVNQLDILHEPQVAFANLVANGLDFIKYISRIGWFDYVNLDKLISLDVLVKESSKGLLMQTNMDQF